MSDDLLKRTKAWLLKAHSDLRTASILASDVDPPFDTAVYHCQQAAEKSVKAVLHHNEAPVQKTHDMERLVRQASAFDPNFGNLVPEAQLLAPLVTSFRYPDETDWEAPAPTKAEFDEAFAAAQRIYDFVLSVLPPETHPA